MNVGIQPAAELSSCPALRLTLLVTLMLLVPLGSACCGLAGGGGAPPASVGMVAEPAEALPTTPLPATPLPVAPAPVDPDKSAVIEEARLTRLTEPGCCTQPFWSADGRSVLFVDRPAPDAPVGIWSIDVERPDDPPELVTDEIAYYSADMAYRIDLDDDTTALIRLADGRRWTVPAGGRPVHFSPDRTRIAWQVAPAGVPYERRTSRIWVADLEGTNAREIATLPRGSLSGWLTNDELMVRGRDALGSREDVLWVLDSRDGARREIARAERMRGQLPSPDGEWIAYYVSRQVDPSRTGIWLVSAAGGEARRLDRSLFGAYRWRDEGRLLVVPLLGDTASHELVEVDAATLDSRRLTDPATIPFKIANGDWSVSPDGERIAFVESRDKSIWVLELPTGGGSQ